MKKINKEELKKVGETFHNNFLGKLKKVITVIPAYSEKNTTK